jgi:hypothetical protein
MTLYLVLISAIDSNNQDILMVFSLTVLYRSGLRIGGEL